MKQEERKTKVLILSIVGVLALTLVPVVLLIVYFTDESTKTESMINTESRPNRLINEKSPYLIKHAYNPVDWYPWGDEAFEKALKEDKPIWLSIGYSTCHWCNVMERESYSDTEVGALMNDVFISVKVDREERPDIDNIYMAVCQLLLQSSCGWPLNIILTPDKKPFYAATYLPKTARFGRAGMVALIPRIKEIWKEDRDNAFSAANKITTALASFAGGLNGGEEELDETVFNKAFEIFRDNFDEEFGGFAESPKFPTPHNLSFLLRHWRRTGNEKSLAMVEKTLQAMRRGGIYDQIGLGFHRYSTDKEWLVPHFEKMLYDQALLAMAYTEAYQATGKEFYARTAKEIFTYVLRDMTSGEGVFYSAEDAESEEEEGKFYLWTKTEIENSLEEEEARLVIKAYNVESEGNWFDPIENKKPGTNILHLKSTPEELSAELKISEKEIEPRLEKARKKLFDIRKKRIHPYKDDKSITDWNGLMIAAFAKGANVFDEPLYLSTAKRAADFILEKMRQPDGRLLHMYRKGEAGVPAMVDDYAYLMWGLLELYENSFDIKYLKEAIKLAELLVTDFWDEKNGGFFFSAKDNEKVLIPWKDFNDGATPSGNSVAMLNLLRLGRITAIPEFEEKASEIGRAIAAFAGKAPTMHINILTAFDFGLGPSYELVIVGDKEANDTKAMLHAVRSRFIPNKVVVFRPSGKEKPEIVKIAKFTENQTSIDGKATAYVCLNYNCKLPTTDINVMLEFLDTGRNPS